MQGNVRNVIPLVAQIAQHTQPPPPPADIVQRETIDKLAHFVVVRGLPGFQVEFMVKSKERENPLFAFLFGGIWHDYYQWLKVQLALNAVTSLLPGPHPISDQSGPVQMLRAIVNSTQFLHHQGAQQALFQMRAQLPAGPPQQITSMQPPQVHPGHLVHEQAAEGGMGSNDDQGDGTFSHEQKQEFETLLDQLSGSKDSIKLTKDWVLDHVDHSDTVIKFVRRHMLREPEPKRRLVFIYLISDCLHHSLKLRPLNGDLDAFSTAVKNRLVDLLKPVYTSQDEETKSKVTKLIRIWDERNYFDSTELKNVEQELKRLAGGAEDAGKADHVSEKSDFQPNPHTAPWATHSSPADPSASSMPPPWSMPPPQEPHGGPLNAPPWAMQVPQPQHLIPHPMAPPIVGLMPQIPPGHMVPPFIHPPVFPTPAPGFDRHMQFEAAPRPMDVNAIQDPNVNLPVGILVDHWKKTRPPKYAPLDPASISTDVPFGDDDGLRSQRTYERFMQGLPK